MRQISGRSPMELKGSCQCGSVKFTVQSPHPYPFNLCYCSICRKTAGGGGYAINLSGRYQTLKVKCRKNISVYRARRRDETTGKITKSTGRRHFCKKCGSALWLWDPQWPELVHPFASAIDTDLPVPPERTHLAPSARGERATPFRGEAPSKGGRRAATRGNVP